jgi:hypothetical protein
MKDEEMNNTTFDKFYKNVPAKQNEAFPLRTVTRTGVETVPKK